MSDTTLQSLLVSRGTQLVARYAAMALVATGTVSAAKSDVMAGIVAQYAVAALLVLFDHFVHSQRGGQLIADISAKIQPWLGDLSLGDLFGQIKANTLTANQALSTAVAAANVANAAHAVATKADATANAVNQMVAPRVGQLPIL